MIVKLKPEETVEEPVSPKSQEIAAAAENNIVDQEEIVVECAAAPELQEEPETTVLVGSSNSGPETTTKEEPKIAETTDKILVNRTTFGFDKTISTRMKTAYQYLHDLWLNPEEVSQHLATASSYASRSIFEILPTSQEEFMAMAVLPAHALLKFEHNLHTEQAFMATGAAYRRLGQEFERMPEHSTEKMLQRMALKFERLPQHTEQVILAFNATYRRMAQELERMRQHTETSDQCRLPTHGTWV